MPRDITTNFWRIYSAAVRAGNFGIARSVAYRAISFFTDQNDKNQTGIWQRVLSNVFFLEGNYPQAITEGNLALELQSDPYERALMYVALGNFMIASADFESAFNLFDDAVKIGDDFRKDVYLWTHLYGSRALAYRRTGDLDKAIIDWEGAAALLREQGQMWRSAGYINNIGFLLIRRGELVEAETRLGEALDLVRQDPHLHTEAIVRDSLGYLYTLMDRHNEAERQLEKSVAIFEKVSDNAQLIGSLLHLSELRQRQLYFDEAHELAIKSLDLASEIKSSQHVADARERLKQVTIDRVVRTRTESPVFSEVLRVTSINSARPGRNRDRE